MAYRVFYKNKFTGHRWVGQKHLYQRKYFAEEMARHIEEKGDRVGVETKTSIRKVDGKKSELPILPYSYFLFKGKSSGG